MHLLKAETQAAAPRHQRGFSLVEVVVAVGIFAIAVIAIIGLMVPINQSVANVRDGDDAVRVASVIQAELQRVGITQVNTYLTAGTTLYANRNGDKVGTDVLTAPWNVDVPDLNGDGNVDDFEKNAQKFFEVKLTQNPTQPFAAATEGFLAVNIEIRWPGYTGDGNKIQNDAREQQSVLIVPAALTR
jgi:uncharacterized protein (TIGR02598 family)